MHTIEPRIEAMIRRLAAEGRPVEEIAFATRIGLSVIAEILAKAGDEQSATKAARPAKAKATKQSAG